MPFLLPVDDAVTVIFYVDVDLLRDGVLMPHVKFGSDWNMYCRVETNLVSWQ